MSRHEGVSCDSCLKGNFRGRRYKCLICYDYDLCALCYESGATNTRHTTDHPMQCILTRADFDIYYGGEAMTALEMPQSFTCPYCSRMGFTEITLHEHLNTDHPDTSFEVVCPLCAAMHGGDPNLMTEDFAGHLSLEHRPGPRDLISFLDEPVASRHNVRRMPQTASRGSNSLRPRRSNMHFSSSGFSSLSPSSRESVDPIAELLSQLSGVRRSTSNTSSSGTPSQLQQLQMQLQLERQQVTAARQNLERFPRRPTQSQTVREGHTSSFTPASMLPFSAPVLIQNNSNNASPSSNQAGSNSQFLLSSLLAGLAINPAATEERHERCSFVQELFLSTMTTSPDNNGREEESCAEIFNNLIQTSRIAGSRTAAAAGGTENAADEEDDLLLKPPAPPRLTSRVLRGRARQDNQNAKRRADANRKNNANKADTEENR